MNYDCFFEDAVARLRGEQRYRVFTDLERVAGRFPHAIWHSPQGSREVVVWCSNDYLGMGQHPKVVGAMVEAARQMGKIKILSVAGLLARGIRSIHEETSISELFI